MADIAAEAADCVAGGALGLVAEKDLPAPGGVATEQGRRERRRGVDGHRGGRGPGQDLEIPGQGLVRVGVGGTGRDAQGGRRGAAGVEGDEQLDGLAEAVQGEPGAVATVAVGAGFGGLES